VVLKFLHASAIHDRSALSRFLARNRMAARISHESLPAELEAGIVDGKPYLAYDAIDAKPLAPRIARTGALHVNEARALLHGILRGLEALHRAGLVHGAVKLENVLIGKNAEGQPRAMLVDAGGDLLVSSWIHSDVATTGGNRIKGAAPEQLKGLGTTPRSDYYAFGALLFEVLTGRPPLEARTATELAMAHFTKKPPVAAELAPKGWVSKELSDLCARLLEKEPSKRPATVEDILEVIGPLATKEAITDEELNECIDTLVADPTDREAAIALELTVERGAKPRSVADAFLMAAEEIDLEAGAQEALATEAEGAVGEAKAEAARDRSREVKKTLLFRSARLFELQLKDHKRAEEVYKWVLDLDLENDVAREGYEQALRAQDKHEELVEMLLERSQNSPSHSERAQALNKIGHLYAGPLEDMDQAVFAFSKALAQDVQNQQYADDLEKAASDNMRAWAEVMRSLHEVSDHPRMPQEVRTALYMRLGSWYTDKIARPDLALPCFERVLRIDPAHLGALEGMVALYRRAQQWKELVAVLQTCIDRATTPERARDYRAEAAEIYETKLNDHGRARELYLATLDEDPSHQHTVDALSRIFVRENDHVGLVRLLERRATALGGDARAETLCRIGEIYEEKLDNLGEAQRSYEAALAFAPTGFTALRNLDRIFSRTGKYGELLDNLKGQVRVAATPRQKITLHERIAGIYEEEFLDNANAAEALEKVLELDPKHEGAMSRLLRLYRGLERWDDLNGMYERCIDLADTDEQRIGLLLAQGETLLEHIGSPERARQAYEKVLEIDSTHARALNSLAELRAATGDAMAALQAVESLAEKATTPEGKAELWIRAGKILEDHGDRDGAIQRYKLALDASPAEKAASVALRAAYLSRGDATSATELIAREIEQTEGELAKARLYCELAELYRDKLGNKMFAKEAAGRAVTLDPTNMASHRILGDLAFEAEQFIEASKHYGALAPRVDAMGKEQGKQILLRYIDALANSGSTEQARDVVPALLELAPDDPEVLRRAARVRLDSKDGAGAAELYQELHQRFFESCSHEEKVALLLNYGRALRLAGEYDAARTPLQDVCDLEPDSTEPIEELCKTYEAQQDWEQVVSMKKRLLDLASGDQRSTILLEIGEVLASHIKDPTRASKSLVAALEERPEDRRILARLMKLYSEEKDWNKLVEVVLKLAEGVEDKVQKAKYVHTAAVVSAQQIHDLDQAIKFFDEVLELDPKNQKALEESIEIREQKGDFEGVVKFLKIDMERAEAASNSAKVVQCLDRLATLYQEKLGNTAEAVTTLEQAQRLDSDNAERRARLGKLYSDDVSSYLDKAVEIQLQTVRENPFNAQHYRGLRKLYTEARQADGAWCLCQAMHCMNQAEPDEERFFRRMRSETAAEAKKRLTDEDWASTLIHPEMDPLVTGIFTMVEPAVMRKNAKPLESLGYQPAYAIDLAVHPYPMSQTMYYAAGVLGMTPPLTFLNPNDPGGVSFLHGRPPAIVLGAAALATELPTQAAAFIAARHLTYYRPGLYIRHLVPTGTGLRSWLFAAIKLIHPGFPIAPELDATVKENAAALDLMLVGPTRDRMSSAVSKLLTSGAIDLKKWVAAVDLSADRAGFLVCHDLEVASEMVRASEEGSAAVPQRERVKELTLFSVGKSYLDIRKHLGINIDR
jgi:tetratricopeptide (TPR) repeat protein